MSFETLLAKIERRDALIGVIGLGYVGLPLALTFANVGFRVLGFDTDAGKAEQLRRGESYIGHLPAERIADAVASGRFDATSEMARLAEPDVIVICVPTPLTDTRDPDLSYIEQTSDQTAKVMRPGQLIVLESTTYPGTTRDVMLPRLLSSGLKFGEEFFVAYSPEREDPGNATWSTSKVPKVVGGLEDRSGRLAAALYRQIVNEVVPVSSSEVAEACKILENVYRAVNIALVNELKMTFERMGLDIWEVIEAAKTKPFGFQAFYPGPGLGGHCIPIDPFYLSWVAKRYDSPARFIELAGEINAQMPEYVVQKLTEALNDDRKSVNGSKIAILGVAYKKDVDDPRESPAFRLIEQLIDRGAVISYNDPHIAVLPKMRSFEVPALTSQPLTSAYLADQDCVLIVTDHSTYDWQVVADHARLVIDTRNAMRRVAKSKARVVKA